MGNVYDNKVTLNNGVKMPWLGLGVWRAQEGGEVENAVKWATEAGYRAIDTAMIYQNEAGVGKAVSESGIPRSEIFVTTKLWNTDGGYEKALKAFDESRKRLGFDYIDLYLIHWPISSTFRDSWKALCHLYKEGYVRAIGVSNFDAEKIDIISDDTGVVPAVNQVQLHPLNTQKELLQYSNKKGIRLTAWRPLLKGKFNILLIFELAEKYGRSPAQILLRWSHQNGVIVIPKSVHKERIIENAGFFDFELSLEDMQKIDNLNENKHFGNNAEQMEQMFYALTSDK
ncbi:MAG: Glyoxal reductase [Firmicutes bacterium ADurb.Bin193]|nr:MAG: Glyoxal reductase [Firmicutes bacterium ADurb.Bin193]